MVNLQLKQMPDSLKSREITTKDQQTGIETTRKISKWTSMDEMFEDMIKGSRFTFTVISNINIILVALGVVFLSYTMLHSWFIGSDLSTVITGVGGLGIIVTNFFVAPQTHITQSLGDKGQIQIIYKTWYTQSELVHAYIEQIDHLTLQQTLMLSDILQDYTEKSVKLIEESLGPRHPPEGKPITGG